LRGLRAGKDGAGVGGVAGIWQGNRIWRSQGLSSGSLRLSRVRGRPTRAKGAAGGGSLHTENPDAEAPPPRPSPQAGEGSQRRCRCTFGLICDCPALEGEGRFAWNANRGGVTVSPRPTAPEWRDCHPARLAFRSAHCEPTRPPQGCSDRGQGRVKGVRSANPSHRSARTDSRRRGWCGSRRAWSGRFRSCGGCA
jgi:hypothetical protein